MTAAKIGNRSLTPFSPFYFFLKNADLNKILNELPNPLEG
jgi:hypothetical protein